MESNTKIRRFNDVTTLTAAAEINRHNDNNEIDDEIFLRSNDFEIPFHILVRGFRAFAENEIFNGLSGNRVFHSRF